MLPIGIIGFNRPLVESESLVEIGKAWLREIFAISGHSAYNKSWWFNALIIEMYLLFPLLYYGLKYACIPTLLFVCLQRHLSIAPIGMNMQIYLPIFAIGMALAANADTMNHWAQSLPKWMLYIIAALSFITPLIILPIIDDGYIYHSGIVWYGILTIAMAMLIILSRKRSKNYFGQSLAFMGKHSSNIYWMHTLIYFYWFPKYFYALHNPILIFISLMGVCLLISIGIEEIKKLCRYNQLINKVLNKIE